MMDAIGLLKLIFKSFLSLVEKFYNLVFHNVDFAVLWRWLPSDIGVAANALIVVLLGVALISLVRRFLPF